MNPFRAHWQLDESIRFLNHGSFGATPLVVLRRQQEYRDQMEREPVRFFVREAPQLLDRGREKLGKLLGADPECLAFVRNATEGVNSVLRSLPLTAGDDLLVTDHEYNACRNVLDYVAAEKGAKVVVATLPFPIADPQEVVNAIAAAATPKTKLLLVDHVTSPTGLVLPLEAIVKAMTARGIATLVDGAHAPGMVPLAIDSLAALGAAYYTGNCHKWLCAPKGTAFLYVRRDKQHEVRPAIISHGANAATNERSRFRQEFDWTGTQDISGWLALANSIDFLERIVPGGLEEVRTRNRALALEARSILLEALHSEPICPESMIGSLAAVRIPDRKDSGSQGAFDTDPLQDRLLFEDHIEVPVMPWPRPPQRLLRVSAQLYNERAEYEALAAALARGM